MNSPEQSESMRRESTRCRGSAPGCNGDSATEPVRWKHNETFDAGFPGACPKEDSTALRLRRAHAYNFGRSTELLVIVIALLALDVISLEQGHARVQLESQALRQPDFIVHPRLLQHKARSFMKARQK